MTIGGIAWSELIFGYVFYYPFFMAWVWIAGGFAHVLVFERKRNLQTDPLTLLPSTPLVSVVVPCHNEEAQVEEVIEQLMRSRYPDFEVIAVNDGSTDRTGALLDALAQRFPRLRVVHNSANQGKPPESCRQALRRFCDRWTREFPLSSPRTWDLHLFPRENSPASTTECYENNRQRSIL
ncbi:MAG: glycosyltransferase [Comamonadaceae bacterium]|nr:MAG: glycosyltransferase [Comamonadaceae bacterium]